MKTWRLEFLEGKSLNVTAKEVHITDGFLQFYNENGDLVFLVRTEVISYVIPGAPSELVKAN